MKKFYYLGIVMISLLVTSSRPLPVRHNLIFDFTAENANCLTKFGQNLLQNYNSIGECCSYSAARVSTVARAGKYSIRYELRKTDKDVYKSKRVEASRASNDEPTLTERWYGASYYLPADYIIDPAPEALTQWQSKKGTNPPLAIWTIKGRWKLVIFGDINKATDLGIYTREKWTDFVLHVRWSTGPAGTIEIWKDGVKFPLIAGQNSYAGYSTGNYEKNGIYKWPWKNNYPSTTSKRVVFIDEVRIGNEKATYQDVAPGD